MKMVILEALVVAACAALLAFAANAISPKGLRLARDYFPEGTSSSGGLASTAVATNGLVSKGTNASLGTGAKTPEQKLKELGLQVLDTAQTRELFQHPGTEQGSIVFIDARDRKHYEEGHIRSAYEFDHYRPEQYLATVVPVTQSAEKIVIYCHGGECDDSRFAAIFLRDSLSIPVAKLYVYLGGITEWSAANLPIETGERSSGLRK